MSPLAKGQIEPRRACVLTAKNLRGPFDADCRFVSHRQLCLELTYMMMARLHDKVWQAMDAVMARSMAALPSGDHHRASQAGPQPAPVLDIHDKNGKLP